METPNSINSRIRELELENKNLKFKNKVYIDCILILKNGLNSVANFDEELEDIYADTGYLAQETLQDFRDKMKELNVNA